MSKRSREDVDADGPDSSKRARDLAEPPVCYLLERSNEDERGVIWGMLSRYSDRIRVGRTCKDLHQEIANVTARDAQRLNWCIPRTGPRSYPISPHAHLEPLIDAVVSVFANLPVCIEAWEFGVAPLCAHYKLYRIVIGSPVATKKLIVRYEGPYSGDDARYFLGYMNVQYDCAPSGWMLSVDEFTPYLKAYVNWLCRPMTGYPSLS